MRLGRHWTPTLAATLFLFMTPFAWAEGVLHARVSFEGGSAMIKGQSDSDWSYATLNTLVLPGDVLWADDQATIEVEFSGGAFLRMADQSRAEVISVPPEAIVRGWTGSFYIQRVSRAQGSFVFRTPAADIVIDRDSHVRVDVVEGGSTAVAVRWGEARIRVQGSRDIVVRRGKRSYVDVGLLPSSPDGFDLAYMDAFDEWSRQRAELLAIGEDRYKRSRGSYDSHIGYLDLDRHGDWVSVSGRSYWQPSQLTSFVPYRDGYWSYTPSYGHVWVGRYPFSYYTSHYGRWTYNNHYGWLWSYSDGWGPAWVTGVRYGDYYIWTPVDHHGHPVVYGNAYFSVGGLRFSYSTASYCHNDYLYTGYHHIGGVPYNFHNDYYVRPNNVYTWNFYSSGYYSRFARNAAYARPLAFNTTSVLRDYSPRRVIRGHDTVSANSPLARSRAVQLENRVQSVNFNRSTPTRGTRTTVGSSSRTARVRNASIAPDNRAMTRSITQRVESTRSAPSASVPPTGRTGNAADAATGPRTVRDTSSSPSRSTTSSVTRSTSPPRSTPSDRGRSIESDTPARTSTPARSTTRTPRNTRSVTQIDTESRGSSRSTPQSTPSIRRQSNSAPATRSTPSASRPESPRQPASVTRVPTTPQRTQISPRSTTPTRTPSISQRTAVPRSAAPSYTPSIPQRTTAPRSVPSAPSISQRTSTPRQQSVSRPSPAPRVSTPAPSIQRSAPPTRMAPAPRSTAPRPSTRSIQQSRPAPRPSPSISNRSSAPQLRSTPSPAPRMRAGSSSGSSSRSTGRSNSSRGRSPR